jgi:3-methyladenine DNA glycosylase AlkD
MNLSAYTRELHQYLASHGEEEIALKQSQYMRNRFPFFGLMKENQDRYWKEFQDNHEKIAPKDSVNFCRECIQYPEREMWYIGQKTIIKNKNKLVAEDLEFAKQLIVQSDWWDVVDLVSSHIVGTLCSNFPELTSVVNTWIENEKFWLRRAALIYQLSYKEKTNEETLYRHISLTCHESEFFIRKAIGWALREYSKYNPESVRTYITKNRAKLSPLSIKEGSKYI